MIHIRAALLLGFCAALLGACGAATGVRPAPDRLPTAFVAVRLAETPRVVAWPLASQATPAPQPASAEARRAAPTIAPTAAPPPPSEGALASTVTPLAADAALLEALLVAEMNRVRAAHGLPPYRHSPDLSAAARAHSCDLAAHGAISHSSSDGRTLADRLAGAIPPWEWPSESIAAGFANPAAVVALWMDEPPDGWHRRNILDTDQREVGAGYCHAADDATGNHHYWTADFSRRASQ
jgi:uncharacterized protein YkwD